MAAEHVNFSKTTLEKLPLPKEKTRAVYYDKAVPKLALRVTAAGTKTFYVIKRVGPETIWFKLGIFPDMTVENARKEAQVQLGKFADGHNPAEARRALKAEPTLAEFFKEYGERYGQRKKSWRDDQQRFRDYLEKPLAKRKLSTITREMIGRILSDMDRQGKAGATVNAVRALASGLFAKAIEWSIAAENPVKGIKTRKTVKRNRFLRGNELPRFFASVAQEPNVTIRDYFVVSLLTGARRSNVLAMRWRELDLEGGLWCIPATKNGTPQNVPLSPEVVTLLKARYERADKSMFVFPGSGKTGHLVEPKDGWTRIFDRDEVQQLKARIEDADAILALDETESLTKQLARARARAAELNIDVDGARLEPARIHDLRRTLGSWQAKKGASLLIIGKSLNHKSPASTLIYAHLDDDPVRQSMNSANTAILEAAGSKAKADVIPLPKKRSAR